MSIQNRKLVVKNITIRYLQCFNFYFDAYISKTWCFKLTLIDKKLYTKGVKELTRNYNLKGIIMHTKNRPLITRALLLISFLSPIKAFSLVYSENILEAVKPVDFNTLYSPEIAKSNLTRQLDKNIATINALIPNSTDYLNVALKMSERASLPQPLNYQQALTLLCGEYNYARNFASTHSFCELNPGFEYDGTFRNFSQERDEPKYWTQRIFENPSIVESEPRSKGLGLKNLALYGQVLSVFQQLDNAKLFNHWLLTEMIKNAILLDLVDQIQIIDDQLVFSDPLAFQALNLELRNKLVNKSTFVPDGVVFSDTEQRMVGINQRLVDDHFTGGRIPVERTNFKNVIGSYTFPLTLLYFQKMLEGQSPYTEGSKYRDEGEFLDFYNAILPDFAITRWVIWGDLFVSPIEESVRNVETRTGKFIFPVKDCARLQCGGE